jgi:23S rRNA pseudouridine955/2504/2580 synthase
MKDLNKPGARPEVTWVEVGEESAAQRIDNFLLRRLRGVPKSHVYRVLRSGQVRVNSGRVGPDYRLQIGDRVRLPPVRVSAAPKTARPAEFPVVYEDAALLVIDKPTGVAVHGGSGLSFGVIESLRASRPQTKVLELAHRLDRDTSGLLIVCKKRSALVEVHRQLREGEVEKIYATIVKGTPAQDAFELSQPLHKYVMDSGERRVSVHEGGMSALTRVKVMKKGRDFSLLEVRLLTGRTHQIRVHLAYARLPIVGDPVYGRKSSERDGLGRQFLHAWRLSVNLPHSGPRTFTAPLADDLRTYVSALGAPSATAAPFGDVR